MRMSLIKWSSLVSLMLFLSLSGVAQAGIAVIAHPSNPLAGISQEQLERIYMGKTREFPNGAPVTALDLREGSVTRAKFYKSITDKSEAALKAYWSKLLFTGQAQPPKEMNDDDAVKEWVSKNPDALGYVDGKSLDKSVKVLLILP